MLRSLLTVVLVAADRVWSYDQLLGFNGKLIKETRPIEEIYKAALAEGGRCSQWMGGDEKVCLYFLLRDCSEPFSFIASG